MRNNILGGIAVVIIAAAAYVFFSGRAIAPITPVASPQPQASPTSDAGQSSSIVADNQSTGSSVLVKSVVFQAAGFVAVHSDVEGAPGPVVGVSALLSAGSHSAVTIAVDPALEQGKKYYAMLHTDDGDGVYRFPGPDAPTKDLGGNIVIAEFMVAGASAKAVVSTDVAVAIPPVKVEALAAVEFSLKSGNFFFEPKELKVKMGAPVTIHITNSGFHTFTVDGLGVNQTFSGPTATVTFTPSKKGTFEFYCAIGSHRAMGMKGTITVE